MESEGLSVQDLLILKSIDSSSDLHSLAKGMKIPRATLGMKIARLQLAGYIGENGALTDKGRVALKNLESS